MSRGPTQADESRPPGQLYCPTCEKTFDAGERCPADGTKLVRLKAHVDPNIGRELDGRYTIIEKLGQGGMGAVYRAQQHDLGREVAIKVVSSHLVSEPDVVKRFMREAKLASKLSHPNAVAVLEFGQTDDGLFYLVMELVKGRTLDQVFKADRQFKPERLVRIGAQVCDALEGAHALQIVHRDLKPANIMLLTQGRDLVKVLDFGLAKSVAPDQTSTTMTNAGALLGTPAFMPPELALGEPCDGRADLYSLGVVLYLLGAGRLPFASDSAHELIAMHAAEPAPPMTGVPPALAHVIDRMLRKAPEARYQSAAENREALEAALENRYLTPAAGVSVAGSTSPSLGPFPANSADFAHLATPVPRARGATELDKLVNSDTMAAMTTPVPPAATLVPRSSTTKRWLVPLGVAAALAIGGISAFLVVGGGSAKPPAPAAPPPEPTSTVVIPATPPPAPPAPAIATKPPEPPTTTKTIAPATPTKPKHHPVTQVAKPPVTPIKPVTPPPPPPTNGSGAGSGKAKAPLPF